MGTNNVPLQSGNPTLVPNFYPARVNVDPGPQNKQVMTNTSPAAIVAGDARANAHATVTIGGSATPADTLSITLTNPCVPGSPITKTYTVGASDTLQMIAEGLADLINDDPVLSSLGIEADVGGASGLVITINHAGPVGNGTGLTVAKSGGATETIVASAATLAGGSGPVIPTQNFTFAVGGTIEFYYYGVPKDVPYNTLQLMISSGQPIS